MPRCWLIILLVLFLLVPARSQGAGQRSLLRLYDFSHFFDLTYRYDGDNYDNGTTTRTDREHLFVEEYTARGSYSLLQPEILTGTWSGSGVFNQDHEYDSDRDTKSSSGLGWQYYLSGLAYKDNPLSGVFSTQRNENYLSRSYGSDYDTITNVHRLRGLYRRDNLEGELAYTLSDLTTDGLDLDREERRHQVDGNLNHTIPYRSYTSLVGSYTDAQTDFDSTPPRPSSEIERWSAALTNQVILGDRLLNHSLTSGVSHAAENSDQNLSSLNWYEQLEWQLGRALWSEWRTDYSRDEYPDYTETNYEANAELEHHLFQNLTSILGGDVHRQDTENSNEDRYGGYGSLDYEKQLPQQNHLSVVLDGSYQVTDRSGDLDTVFVFDEKLLVKPINNYLKNPDVDVNSVQVRSGDRVVLYVEGIDYTLRNAGRLTEIVIPFGSAISVADLLSIDYYYGRDPDLKYATKQYFIGTELASRDNIYRGFFRYNRVWEDLLSGNDDEFGLLNDFRYTIGAETNQRGHHLLGQYTVQRSVVEKHDAWELEWDYEYQAPRYSIALNVAERYLVFKDDSTDVPGATESENTENTIALGGSLQTRLWQRVNLNTIAQYYNLRGRVEDRDGVLFDSGLNWSVGMTRFWLKARVKWEWRENGISRREDLFFFRMRRFL
jgi:hypothetical protein